MNNPQLLAAIRQVITASAAYAIGAGYASAEQAGALVELATALVLAASIAWSLFASRKAGIVASAASLSNVTAIEVTTHAFADKVPSEKVQTSGG